MQRLTWHGMVGALEDCGVFFFSHAIASYDFLFCVCIFWYCISLSDWPFYLKPRLMILLAMLSRHIFLYLCYSSDMKSNWIHRLILVCIVPCSCSLGTIIYLILILVLQVTKCVTLVKSLFLGGGGTELLVEINLGLVFFVLVFVFLTDHSFFTFCRELFVYGSFQGFHSVLSLGLLQFAREA